ncbi:contractile injection system tape measure protein [Chitinophaga sp. S165]|uniref:contractile injection system tape measure protein n=1 Tax=Chitinophaga sp. S165 TaxID=2135462 RepID=UPI000D70F7AD|nr:contractile injection system tape measure protein [Chitinophaga sp. S165]PWV56941.1 hypothetical protein C7475_1011461 [Chitinophaga sp. S165]
MEQQHAIGKLLLEVQLPSREDAFALQGALSTRCTTELEPMLAELLDSWADPDTLLQIDKLEIDLGSCDMETLRKELPGMVIDYLRKNYQGIQTQLSLEAGMQRIPLTQGYYESWLYFLERGILPSSAVKWRQEEWEAGILAALSSETYALQQCKVLLLEYPYAIRRLVLQFSPAFVHSWIQAYSADAYRQVLQLMTEWEVFAYHPRLKDVMKTSTALQQMTMPVLPDRATYQEGIIIWLIREIIVPGRTISNAALLQQLMQRLTGRVEEELVASWLYILQKTTTAPVKAAVLLQETATALSTQYAAEIIVLQKNIADNRPVATQDKVSPEKTDVKDRPEQQQASQRKDHEQGTSSEASTGKKPEEVRTDKTSSVKEEQQSQQQRQKKEQEEDELAGTTAKHAEDGINSSSSERAVALSDEAGTTPEPPSEGTVYYINNAGLILLHPYLSFFFDALELRDGKQFKDEAAKHRAVQLLGYLAYGEEEIPEYDLVLPKLLCGILPAEPVKRFVPLTDLEKTEANELLTSVISHWNALGNTSPDGLRGNFLLREGKLEWKEEEWQLYVTQQAYDMLLNRLPWGFSVVGLSWMPWLIKTVWT